VIELLSRYKGEYLSDFEALWATAKEINKRPGPEPLIFCRIKKPALE
jgi:hypothetical protein